MAQDFAAAFDLGDTNTGIATVDADGVALAAIQELKKQLDAVKADNAALAEENAIKSAEIADLQRQQAAIATDNAALKANLSDFAARLAALEAKLRE
jgi:septal ring factor EnvC (AmiA/AmiB activator)